MTAEEIAKVEKIVNDEISRRLEGAYGCHDRKKKRKRQALWLFGEKYGEKVRAASMGRIFQGVLWCGTVKNTGVIFSRLFEEGVAGVRQVEAFIGDGVFSYYKDMAELERGLQSCKRHSCRFWLRRVLILWLR